MRTESVVLALWTYSNGQTDGEKLHFVIRKDAFRNTIKFIINWSLLWIKVGDTHKSVHFI